MPWRKTSLHLLASQSNHACIVDAQCRKFKNFLFIPHYILCCHSLLCLKMSIGLVDVLESESTKQLLWLLQTNHCNMTNVAFYAFRFNKCWKSLYFNLIRHFVMYCHNPQWNFLWKKFKMMLTNRCQFLFSRFNLLLWLLLLLRILRKEKL